MTTLSAEESYAWCHELMRSAARNFYYGMRLLPEAKRQAMYALYSFMRLIDDIADEPGAAAAERVKKLESWRKDLHAAVKGETHSHPLWPALADTIARFAIPIKLLDEAIDGQLQDLVQSAYTTFIDLYGYCYRVASTVGIAAIHIFGFRDRKAVALAEERGIAMQLTNILRDIREDAARGRRYIPIEDCARFGCDDWSFGTGGAPAGFEPLIAFEAGRAREYYQRSSALESMIDADARATLKVMTSIYRGILDRIIATPRAVLSGRVGLSKIDKLKLVMRHTLGGRGRGRAEGSV